MSEQPHWNDIVAALTEMRGYIQLRQPGLLPMLDQALSELTELRKLRNRLVECETAWDNVDLRPVIARAKELQ